MITIVYKKHRETAEKVVWSIYELEKALAYLKKKGFKVIKTY